MINPKIILDIENWLGLIDKNQSIQWIEKYSRRFSFEDLQSTSELWKFSSKPMPSALSIQNMSKLIKKDSDLFDELLDNFFAYLVPRVSESFKLFNKKYNKTKISKEWSKLRDILSTYDPELLSQDRPDYSLFSEDQKNIFRWAESICYNFMFSWLILLFKELKTSPTISLKEGNILMGHGKDDKTLILMNDLLLNEIFPEMGDAEEVCSEFLDYFMHGQEECSLPLSMVLTHTEEGYLVQRGKNFPL